MKKTLLAAAALMAISSVSQAAQVEVFDAVDEFVAVNSTGGKWKSALMSGGAGASHVGIKGVEDLGNGVQVFFNLDQAFLADDGRKTFGNDGRAFSREANLGIRGKYGSLSFGRQYTPHFLVFAMYDPTELSLGSSDSPYFFPGRTSVTGQDGNLVRSDNSFMYVLPTSFGMTNFFYVSLGEHKNAAGSQNSNSKGNIYNYAAKFDYGKFSAMGSYLFRKFSPDGQDASWNNQYVNLAVSYDFGVTKPVVQFTKKFTNDETNSANFWMAQIGTSTPLFGGKWMISGSYMKDQTRSDADAWSVGTKYAYPLSKRTRIYSGVEAVFNDTNAGYAIEAGPDSSLHFNLGGNEYGTDYTGDNVVQFFVGMSHQF